MRETELNRLNDRDFPLHALSFAWSVPHAQVAFSSEPSRNLLYATILCIISTSYAYVLSLRRARSPQQHDARDRRAPPQVLQHFDGARANESLFAPLVALISFTLYGANWRTQEPEQNRSRNRDFLNICLVGPHVGPEA